MRSVKEIFSSHEILDDKGRHINGTDKQGPNHSYGNAYEQLFYGSKLVDVKITNTRTEPMHERISIRNEIKLMMEIGVSDGSSLIAWQEIFPNARIVGMDIHPAARILGSGLNCIEFHLGDQRSRADCARAANNRLFDVIVEDATHRLSDTLVTLFHMWPYVKPGGMYIVEEFENVTGDRQRIKELWHNVEIVGTCGPLLEDEPLVVFRKPLR